MRVSRALAPASGRSEIVEALARFEERFPYGTYEREGRVVGAWWVAQDQYPWPKRLWAFLRTEGNRPAAGRVDADGLGDMRRWAADFGNDPDGFGTEGGAWDDAIHAALVLLESQHSASVGEPTTHRRWICKALGEANVPTDRLDRIADEVIAPRCRAVRAFLATLDQEALKFAAEQTFTDAYCEGAYVLLDRTFSPEAPLMEAVRQRPELAGVAIALAKVEPTRIVDAVATGTLDALLVAESGLSAPLRRRLPALITAMGTADPELLARLAESYGLYHADLAVTALHLARDLPPSWLPGSETEWHAFLECLPAVEWVRSTLPEGMVIDAVAAGKGWVSIRDGLMAALADGQDLETTLYGIGDMARAFTTQVLAPALALSMGLDREAEAREIGYDPGPPYLDEDLAYPAYGVLFGGASLASMVERSRRWHAQRPRIDGAIDRLPGSSLSSRWPAGYPDHRRGDWRLTVLTTVGQLLDEGGSTEDAEGERGLDHCVAGYVNPCRSGHCRIASIRTFVDGRWRRAYTVELGRDDDGMPVVRQFAGYRNAAPSLSAQGFVAGYIGFVRGVLLSHASKAELAEALAPLERSGSLCSDAGYRWDLSGHWEAVKGSWGRLLPREWRGKDFRAFAQGATGADGLLKRPKRWNPEEDFPPTVLDGQVTPY